jgi:hypothetical protein
VTDRGDWPAIIYFMGATELRIRQYRGAFALCNVHRN